MLSKKVLQVILLTFLISWSVALAAYLLHITYGLVLSLVIIAVCYMPAPAYATLILQKLVYRGTLTPYGFTLKNLSLRWLLITTVGFAWFIVLGTFVVIAILGNVLGLALFGRIDFSEAAFLQQLTIITRGAFGNVPQHFPIPPIAIFLLSFVQSVIAGFTVNLPFTFGEGVRLARIVVDRNTKVGLSQKQLIYWRGVGIMARTDHCPGAQLSGPPCSGNIYDDVIYDDSIFPDGILPV